MEGMLTPARPEAPLYIMVVVIRRRHGFADGVSREKE